LTKHCMVPDRTLGPAYLNLEPRATGNQTTRGKGRETNSQTQKPGTRSGDPTNRTNAPAHSIRRADTETKVPKHRNSSPAHARRTMHAGEQREETGRWTTQTPNEPGHAPQQPPQGTQGGREVHRQASKVVTQGTGHQGQGVQQHATAGQRARPSTHTRTQTRSNEERIVTHEDNNVHTDRHKEGGTVTHKANEETPGACVTCVRWSFLH